MKFTAKCKNVCCPTLEVLADEDLLIQDDYEGSVRMSQAQFGSLVEQYLEHKLGSDRPESGTQYQQALLAQANGTYDSVRNGAW